MQPGDRLLEVGCATGKATLPLARLRFRITCVEPGPRLVAQARRNLAAFDQVDVVEDSFERWDIGDREPFDLVFAATAWHWLDPARRYRAAWQAMRAGGHLAFWNARHVFPIGGDPFFVDIEDVYEEIGSAPGGGTRRPRPGELEEQRDEIEGSGLFEVVDVRHFDWEQTYDAEGYLDLLATFSGHIAMEPWQRERLSTEIQRRLGQRPDGMLRRHWGCVFHAARRVG